MVGGIGKSLMLFRFGFLNNQIQPRDKEAKKKASPKQNQENHESHSIIYETADVWSNPGNSRIFPPLTFCLCLSVCLCRSIYLSLRERLSHSLSLSLSVSLSLTLALSRSTSRYRFHCLSHSHYLSLSLLSIPASVLPPPNLGSFYRHFVVDSCQIRSKYIEPLASFFFPLFFVFSS